VEVELLAQRGLFTVFQLMEVDEPTGRLSTDENRGLMQELVTHSLLQHKIQLLIQSLRFGLTADKHVGLSTTGFSLFQLDRIISRSARNNKEMYCMKPYKSHPPNHTPMKWYHVSSDNHLFHCLQDPHTPSGSF
jgi:hypothetical protein